MAKKHDKEMQVTVPQELLESGLMKDYLRRHLAENQEYIRSIEEVNEILARAPKTTNSARRSSLSAGRK